MSLINYTTSSNKRILKSSAMPIAQRVHEADLFGGQFSFSIIIIFSSFFVRIFIILSQQCPKINGFKTY